MKSVYRLVSLLLAVLLIPGIAVIGAFADTGAEVISGTFDMHIAFSTDSVKETYYYCDDYFKDSGTKSNEHLRTMSAAMAFSLWGKSDNTERFSKLPREIGFEDIVIYDMDRCTKDSMGVVFGKKTIGDNTVVMIALRSDEYDAEWASNFLCGESGDAGGFSKAADTVKSRLDDYINKYSVTNAKFWITGYSRGGAVANLIGKYLNEHLNDYSITSGDIYDFIFEAPRPSSDDVTYDNIHSIVDCCDVITYVYPETWGMYRNGVDEYIGNTDETVMTKQFNLFEANYTSDYKEVKTADFLKEFMSFLAANLSRETYSKNVESYISRIAEIYFSLNDEEKINLIEFVKELADNIKNDSNTLIAVLPLISGSYKETDVDNLVNLLINHIDALAEEKGKPVGDDDFDYIKSAVTPLVNVLLPVITADFAGVLSDEPDALPALYHILSFAGNAMDIIKHHFNYNVFKELKALDSYYLEEPTEPSTAIEATEAAETTEATEVTRVTETSMENETSEPVEITTAKETIVVQEPTEAVENTETTEPFTDAPTEPVTTEFVTDAPTEPVTTESVTDAPTEPATTESVTDAPTEPATTEPVTDAPTDPAENQPELIDISSWKVYGIKNLTYTGKALKQSYIRVSKDGKYAEFNVEYKNNVKAGTASVTITGKGSYTGAIVKTFKIYKARNPIKVKVKHKVKAKASKKTIVKKAITVKKAKGKVTYKTNNKKIKVKKGKLIIAKGLKKGKKIKVKITVKAKGNGNYKSKKVVKIIKIIVN